MVSIIVPARNEEANLGNCLRSLTEQSAVESEIIVVDDGSIDGTRAIAQSFAATAEGIFGGVRVISAGALPLGCTGKNNAVITGARVARGKWLLFTDADTVHLPGSLKRALKEASREGAEMLSYSPEQMAVTFWEMAVLPVVFAELARRYPPKKVSDPNSRVAAANGQYILIRREAYDAVGGHRAIAGSLLEDVALARRVKAAGRTIRFRYGGDAVRTRMYRNFAQLREGWTKNLALLFPRPGQLAAKMFRYWLGAWALLAAGIVLSLQEPRIAPVAVLPVLFLALRLRQANFGWYSNALGAIAGYPMFVYLLLRSKRAHRRKSVVWKGRSYSLADSEPAPRGAESPMTFDRAIGG